MRISKVLSARDLKGYEFSGRRVIASDDPIALYKNPRSFEILKVLPSDSQALPSDLILTDKGTFKHIRVITENN